MQKRLMTWAGILAILFAWQISWGEITSRNEAGNGFTNNANLETTEPDADLFLKLGTSNSLTTGANRFGLRLGYQDYFKQNPNDVFSWKLSDTINLKRRNWDLSFALFGQQYPHGAPETTDNSFNNIGFETSAAKQLSLNEQTDLQFGPGYSLRRFTAFDGRTDQTAFGFADVTYDSGIGLDVFGRGEGGMLFSNLPEYSKTYLELSGGVEYSLGSNWDLSADLSFRHSYFWNRTILEETVTTRRRGRTVSGTTEAKETTDLVSLGVDLTKKFSKTFSCGAGVNHTGQASRSGLQDYSANEVSGRLILTF